MKITTLEEAEEQGFETYVYDSGDWHYGDTDDNYHLFRDGVELTKGVEAKDCWSYEHGDWEYKDANGNWHRFTKDERISTDEKSKAEPTTKYKTIVKTKDDEVIEDLTHTLVSAQEYFDIDIMPEIMAIAKKIGESNDK